MDKQIGCSHIVEYYSAINGNERLIHVTTWVNYGNIMLSERCHLLKATECMIPIICNVQKRQIHKGWLLRVRG